MPCPQTVCSLLLQCPAWCKIIKVFITLESKTEIFSLAIRCLHESLKKWVWAWPAGLHQYFMQYLFHVECIHKLWLEEQVSPSTPNHFSQEPCTLSVTHWTFHFSAQRNKFSRWSRAYPALGYTPFGRWVTVVWILSHKGKNWTLWPTSLWLRNPIAHFMVAVYPYHSLPAPLMPERPISSWWRTKKQRTWGPQLDLNLNDLSMNMQEIYRSENLPCSCVVN